MEVQPKEIINYITYNGINPFFEWFDSLRDRRAKAKIKAMLDRVEAGNFGDCKSFVIIVIKYHLFSTTSRPVLATDLISTF